jgi:FkbM family methyltransferase
MLRRLGLLWNEALITLQLLLARGYNGNICLKFADIGASAMEKPRIALAFPETEVSAFDPDPRAVSDFDSLDFKVNFYPYAVAGSDGKRRLYLTKKSHCSSLLLPKQNGDERYEIEKEVQVDCRTLDSLGVQADFIKIDTQGAEAEILRGSPGAIGNAHAVFLEFCFRELYEGQSRITELEHLMSSAGFQFAGFAALYYDGLAPANSLIFGDILFVRASNNPSGQKTVLVALIESSFDKLISKFVSPNPKTLKDAVLLIGIQGLGMLKLSGPKIF